ncbi:hypothetical protein BDP27DRAFT_1231783, partial [Rhodocollybia butyracea]
LAPAQGSIQYEVRQFNSSIRNDTTEYQGTPTEALDRKWKDLYECTQISESEANNLVHKTVRIPGDEEYYITSLEVFHQLHCLNLLRKSLYPEYYPLTPVDHLDHCVDTLRQALTCTVDISPLSWKWDERLHITEPQLNGTHQCMNFTKIQEWAHHHQLKSEFNNTVNLDLGLGHEGH